MQEKINQIRCLITEYKASEVRDEKRGAAFHKRFRKDGKSPTEWGAVPGYTYEAYSKEAYSEEEHRKNDD